MSRTLESMREEICARCGDDSATTLAQGHAELCLLDRRDALLHRLRATRGTNGDLGPPDPTRRSRVPRWAVPQDVMFRDPRAGWDEALDDADVLADVDAPPEMRF